LYKQLADRRAFAAWSDQTIDACQMLWQPDVLRRRADPSKDLLVFAKVALKGEDSYCHNRL
jgi:hypothetical protein